MSHNRDRGDYDPRLNCQTLEDEEYAQLYATQYGNPNYGVPSSPNQDARRKKPAFPGFASTDVNVYDYAPASNRDHRPGPSRHMNVYDNTPGTRTGVRPAFPARDPTEFHDLCEEVDRLVLDVDDPHYPGPPAGRHGGTSSGTRSLPSSGQRSASIQQPQTSHRHTSTSRETSYDTSHSAYALPGSGPPYSSSQQADSSHLISRDRHYSQDMAGPSSQPGFSAHVPSFAPSITGTPRPLMETRSAGAAVRGFYCLSIKKFHGSWGGDESTLRSWLQSLKINMADIVAVEWLSNGDAAVFFEILALAEDAARTINTDPHTRNLFRVKVKRIVRDSDSFT